MLHEKPFAGINGSGKHCNWSMAITADNALDGTNLLKPGKTPHQNIRFLIFLAAVLKGVHKHAGLLRAGIGTSGNEHRLGANEAPPAIISVFMGDMLTRLIENIAAGKEAGKGAEQPLIKLGVAKLPEIEKDNTDRNRTSPFAFTGNKFEFRAVGSSQSIAFPITLLHAAVAEAIGEVTDQLRETLKRTKNVSDAVLKVVREAFKETAAVRFEGNNYSDEWKDEAKKRGLLNLRRAPEALARTHDEECADGPDEARHPHEGGDRLPLSREAGALHQGHAHRAPHAGANGGHNDRSCRRATRTTACWRNTAAKAKSGRHRGRPAGLGRERRGHVDRAVA